VRCGTHQLPLCPARSGEQHACRPHVQVKLNGLFARSWAAVKYADIRSALCWRTSSRVRLSVGWWVSPLWWVGRSSCSLAAGPDTRAVRGPSCKVRAPIIILLVCIVPCAIRGRRQQARCKSGVLGQALLCSKCTTGAPIAISWHPLRKRHMMSQSCPAWAGEG